MHHLISIPVRLHPIPRRLDAHEILQRQQHAQPHQHETHAQKQRSSKRRREYHLVHFNPLAIHIALRSAHDIVRILGSAVHHHFAGRFAQSRAGAPRRADGAGVVEQLVLRLGRDRGVLLVLRGAGQLAHLVLVELEVGILLYVDVDEEIAREGDAHGPVSRMGVDVAGSRGGVAGVGDAAAAEGGMHAATAIATGVAADDAAASVVRRHCRVLLSGG
mmetsp:Transcript_23648/g.42796  ORF Transcript_23648/g.42796 Transcript_23648/m.42796 type:complete len:218 (+) Transcript_23648:1048-1701(+)